MTKIEMKIVDENTEINKKMLDLIKDFGKQVFGLSNTKAVFLTQSKIGLFDKRIWHLAYKHKNPLVRKKNLKRLWGVDWLLHKGIVGK